MIGLLWRQVDSPSELGPPSMGLVPAMGVDGLANATEGAAWLPDRLGLYRLIDPCDEPPPFPDESGTRPHLVFAAPVTLQTRYWWQGVVQPFDDSAAEDYAAAVTSAAVARELWTGEGTLGQRYTLPGVYGGLTGQHNAYLQDPATCYVAGGGPYDPVRALAFLDGLAHRRLRGATTPVLHVTPEVVSAAAQYLTVTGGTIRTITGSVVVADAGYTGGGPNGAAGQWGYATGPVGVRLGPINSNTTQRETVDRDVNRRAVWADRTFQVGFDAQSCHIAVPIDYALPALTAPTGG